MRMKTGKGKLKLSSDDVRVGNFVIHTEKEHYKIRDINSVFSFRCANFTPIGQLFKAAILNMKSGDKNSENFIHDYCAVMYNVLSVAPDYEFLSDAQKCALDCLNRHKDLYGIKDDISKEEDDKILKETADLLDAENAARLETLGHE